MMIHFGNELARPNVYGNLRGKILLVEWANLSYQSIYFLYDRQQILTRPKFVSHCTVLML
jgi:hypothetical protein